MMNYISKDTGIDFYIRG